MRTLLAVLLASSALSAHVFEAVHHVDLDTPGALVTLRNVEPAVLPAARP